jgi:hypothetical protein
MRQVHMQQHGTCKLGLLECCCHHKQLTDEESQDVR